MYFTSSSKPSIFAVSSTARPAGVRRVLYNTIGAIMLLLFRTLVPSRLCSGEGERLENIEQQARINSALFFESSILFARLRFCTDNLVVFRKEKIPEENLKRAADGLRLFEAMLQSDYVVGDRLTVADLSCVASVTTLHLMLQPSAADYPKTFAWVERIAKLPYYEEVNVRGLKAAGQLMQSLSGQASKSESE
uniref:glutathione transferase n=1 Tax=Anopheles atroparvus TaxID=41427 RepID=A0A182JAT3_ANOAO